MNLISLDKSNPDIAQAVEGCEVGVPKTLTVTVTPVSDSDTLLVGTVDSVEYTEEEAAIEEEAPATTEKPYKPKARAGSATAVETY